MLGIAAVLVQTASPLPRAVLGHAAAAWRACWALVERDVPAVLQRALLGGADTPLGHAVTPHMLARLPVTPSVLWYLRQCGSG